MEDIRPDSEYLLKKLQYEEEQKLKKNKGKLKIFPAKPIRCWKRPMRQKNIT